jgi:DNA invertase Pin-like site-specific DNA recombinase
VVNIGGRPKGTPNKVTPTVASMIVKMKAEKVPVACIGRELNLSRQTIYEVLRNQ